MSYLRVDRKGRATLPEEARRSLGLRPGDFVLLERTERGTYELVPAALVPREQLWFHHPEMQRRIRKAEADIAEGRTTMTRTLEEAQALLDGSKKVKAGRRSRRRAARGHPSGGPFSGVDRAVVAQLRAAGDRPAGLL